MRKYVAQNVADRSEVAGLDNENEEGGRNIVVNIIHITCGVMCRKKRVKVKPLEQAMFKMSGYRESYYFRR